EWEVKLVESLARFDKWKESSKNLVKLINNSMSTRTKLGLRFKEYNGSDEVFDLSTPSVFDLEPKNKEVKSLYDSDKSSESTTYDFASCVSNPKTNDSFSTVDVKILPKSNVKDPSPTNGFPSCSFKENVKPPRNLCNKSGIADRIPCKNNFVRTKTCFVCGSKSHLIKDCDVYDNVDNFPSIALKAASVLAGSRNSSSSISAGRSILAASRNRPASIHDGRHIPAGRFNKPVPFPAGRSVLTGWTNHAARPFLRPTNLYFDNVSWPGIYDHMSMNEGRWGFAVKSSAGIVDSGCSRSMTGNKEKLDDFVQVKGGTVTFGGGDGKITGKGTIRTSMLNFENVYYVEELQNFNLFSVSQICDKKNKVLFIDDECLPSSSVEAPIIVECAEDHFEELDDILGEYAHIGKQITGNEITRNEITRNMRTGNEITGKQMVVHVSNNSTVDDVLELEMLFETEGVGPVGKFKEIEVDADNESEEESDTKRDYTMDSGSEDLDYDLKRDDVFDDDEHTVEEIHVNMNNFRFTADPKQDTNISGVDVQDDDLDVIDYDSFSSDLDDGIDSERRMKHRKLRRICKQKNKGPNKYYFYLGQQFASKEIMKERVKKHSVETRR
nr:ribonuclease H-like domain-containing protein [Tanacetum cinerariifolium]